MPRKTTGVVVAALSLSLTGAALAAGTATASLPLIDRASGGPVDNHGGAARLSGDQTKVVERSLQKGKAKNVILIIGDGMGDSEITVARNYLEGAGGAFRGLDALPLTGQMTHYSVDRATGVPDYVPDSAATGTAWATGTKSYDNAISVDRHGVPQDTLLELAEKKGLATGNVSTSEIQDATPAVQVAHVALRACKGPVATTAQCPDDALENGGLGSISEQLLDTRPDVTLGGGAKYFEEAITAGKHRGRTVAERAEKEGFTYITEEKELHRVSRADEKRPLLGLFSPGDMPVRFAPEVAVRGGANQPARECRPEPAFAEVPDLATMTDKAIDLLATSKEGRKKGFFLQVESASIDKKDHAADACGQIGETEQIDEAVQSALRFARRHGDTLVLVTADHAHTSQIVDGDTPGLTTRLRTADGGEMIVAYGTSAAAGSQQHTGSQVRVAGYGPGAANVVGLIDQTDLFFIVKRALRLK